MKLDYEAEEAAVLAAAKEDIDLFVEDSGDPEELGRRVNVLELPPPVLHLSCHGQNAWRAGPETKPQPILMMEDAKGEKRPTPASDLINALDPYKPRLVFLSACLSAAAGESRIAGELADSLASVLVRGGLPAVLGWDGSVADNAATSFAQEFYENLARRQPVVQAAAAARLALLGAAGETGGSAVGKDPSGEVNLRRHDAQEVELLRRDWHLARLWLCPSLWPVFPP